MRKPFLLLCLILAVAGFAGTAYAQASGDGTIPPMPLSEALNLFAERTGLQLVYVSEVVEGLQSQGAPANLPPADTLRSLLEGTGLDYRFLNTSTVTIASPEDLQEQGEVPAGTRRSGIEEIVVTARKREESIQDVPIAITALSADDMTDMGIRNVGDMEGIVPGLNMGGGGNGLKKDSNPFIRGVGQRETKVTLDPAVATYIDGIYLARTAGALLDTVGVGNIEVLRGPQGTLFGRNTVGGAISVTTQKPTNEWGAKISTNVGNYGRRNATAMVNVPLIQDTLLSRLTVSTKNSDGYFTNIVDDTAWGDDNRITGIGQLRWLPREDLTFDLLTERTRIRETPRPSKCAVVRPYDDEGTPDPDHPVRPYNPDYFAPQPIRAMTLLRAGHGNPNNRKTYTELCAESEALSSDQFASDFAAGDDLLDRGRYWVDTATVGLTGTWEVGALGPLRDTTLKSISAWRQVEQIADEDLDATGISQLLRYQDGFNETNQLSQELQFTGTALDDRLFFSTGLFYFQEETPQDVLIRTAGIDHGNPYAGPAPPSLGWHGRIEINALEPTRETLETDNEAYAWYGQLDFKLTPQIELTTGLRYTYEKRWSAYSKAYATGSSMITCDQWPGNEGGRDWVDTSRLTVAPCLASVEDWVFYSEQYPGRTLDGEHVPIPGYEDGDTFGPAFGRNEASTSDSAWTPMASIKYHADGAVLDALRLDDAMAYFTYSHGFGAGGVTAGAIDEDAPGTIRISIEDPIIYDPQETRNYEVGFKLQGLDRRVRANVAVFHTDYTDMQITSTANRAGIPIPFIDNVGEAVIRGVEGEFIFLPTANWRVMLNTAYTDADLKEWNARQVILNPFSGAPQDDYEFLDRSDEPMPRVPEWQGYLMTDYQFRLPGGGVLRPLVAARYTSEIYHGFDRGSFIYGRDKVTSDEVTFLDARVSYLSPDEKLELALWGKNLTDKQDHMVGAIPLVDTTGSVGQIFANPRTFGLELTYQFNAR